MTLEKATSLILRSLTPNRPYHVQWMITRQCNYRCRGCDVWRSQNEEGLSTEEIKRGLDILRELGAIEIVLSGGNPLLRDDIGEIIEYASRFFITTVYDNGSIAANKIDELRSADFVAISLDSLNPRKNDYVRGVKDAWSNSMKAIERLHDEGISVSVSPTISQYNLYEILDFTNYFLRKDIPIWYCLYSHDFSSHEHQLFRIGKKNAKFMIADKKAMVNLCDSLIKMKRRDSRILMTTKTLEAVKNFYLTDKRTWTCHALQNFFVIDNLGRVAGCHLHDPVASILDLPNLWNSSKLQVLRRTYKECTRCTYLCYIFYSIHGGVIGNFQIAQERWRSARLLLGEKNIAKTSSLAAQT